MTICIKCDAGPEGMQGHEDLQLLDPKGGIRSSERFVLACQQCGAHWSRVFSGDGISWVRADVAAT